MRVNLRQHGKTRQRPSPAGDVQRCVSVLIHQTWVAAGLQQLFHDMRLLQDDGQVERSLGKHGKKINITLKPKGSAALSPYTNPTLFYSRVDIRFKSSDD